jgi:4-amino-4-deoxy-L-arabinose transferase-like glycosyltransferase
MQAIPRSAFLKTGIGISVLIASAKVALNLAAWDRYGFHRDEWYYITGGLHPSLGYVDHPPLTPLLAGLIYRLFGLDLVIFRLVLSLIAAAIIILAGLMARELGGGRFAQATSALAVLCMPAFLGSNIFFQTVTFDQLVWAVAIYLIIKLVRTGEPRWWLWIGLIFGVGFLTKYTVALLIIALGIGIVLTPERRWLTTRWPYLGAIIAFGVAMPHLLWQIANDFPTLEFIENNGAQTREEFSRLSLVLIQLLFVGPLAVPLVAAGGYWLFRSEGGRWRALGWIAVLPLVLIVIVQGKPYYPAPALPLACVAGAIATERYVQRANRRWLRVALPAALVVNMLIPLVYLVPLLPLETANDIGVFDANGELAETIGWDEMVAQVGAVYATLPAQDQRNTRILTVSYGEAGAIDLLGSKYDLPKALAAHNSYFYWGPGEDWTNVISVGFSAGSLRPYFDSCQQSGVVTNRYDIDNEINGYPILICRSIRVDRDEFWDDLRHFQ